MPSDKPYDMIGADDLNDPVTFRYEMRGPVGLVAQELSVDIKILITEPSYIPAIGEALWSGTIATAISHDVQLDLFWYVRWRSSPLAFPAVPSSTARGRQFGAPAGRAHCPIVLQHTGHTDNYAARAITLPSTPANWQSGGMLTDRGWDSLMTWAHGVKMGLAADNIGGDLQHLLAFPAIVPITIDNFGGVLFRRVTHLKVLQYTDKAPDFQGGIWP